MKNRFKSSRSSSSAGRGPKKSLAAKMARDRKGKASRSTGRRSGL